MIPTTVGVGKHQRLQASNTRSISPHVTPPIFLPAVTSSMAATAADIRSALSIPEPNATAGPSQPKKPAAPKTRKPDGIPRELYSLIGPSAPSLAAQLAKPRLKQKPNFGSAQRVRW